MFWRTVPERNAWVLERLGRFRRVLGPGRHLVVPVLDRVAFRHSLAERTLAVPALACVTRDNRALTLEATATARIVDARLASYAAADPEAATVTAAQAALRAVVGERDESEVFGYRESLNQAVRARLAEEARRWGIDVPDFRIDGLASSPH